MSKAVVCGEWSVKVNDGTVTINVCAKGNCANLTLNLRDASQEDYEALATMFSAAAQKFAKRASKQVPAP